jgi:hypothetical protein
MADCSNCRETMAPLVLEGFGSLQPLEISTCTPCNLFWFDKLESVRLTPKSVLELFQFIGRAGQARNTLKSQFPCPTARSRSR